MVRKPAARVVAILATLDTKGEEALFLKRRLAIRRYDARLVDVGILGDPSVPLGPGDVRREWVSAGAGLGLGTVRTMRRDEAISTMGRGAGAVLKAWFRDGLLAGVLGIGGHQGTAIAGTALQALPLGLPKVLLSTVASGNIRPFIGSSDILVMSSVGDLLGGPNRVTRPVLARAVAVLVGMMEGRFDRHPGRDARPAVAISALGNTHGAVTRVMGQLQAAEYEVVPFHASGAGGTAMEELVEEGLFSAVVDLTPHELLGEVWGYDIYRPVRPGRLTAAGRLGIPQVVAPGGLDYFVFGPPETVPDRFRGRATHYHNPYNTNIRATAEELQRVGYTLGERLNEARGPRAFVYPLRGWSYIGAEGGPLWDPTANDALRSAVREVLHADVCYLEIDARINDPSFADEVVKVAKMFLARYRENRGPLELPG